MVKGQSRPRTPKGGGESRSGMNPGAVGSNPAADTTSEHPACAVRRPEKPACDLSKRRRPTKPRPCREDSIRQLHNARPADNLARSGARHLRDNRECGANPQRAQRCKVDGAARTTGASREGAAPGETKSEDRPDETGAQDGQPAPCFAVRGSDMTTGALRSRPAPSHRRRRKAAPTGCHLPI